MNNSTATKTISLREVVSGDILTLADFPSDINDDEREKRYHQMVETIENRVLARVFDQLSKEEQERYLKLGEEQKHQEIISFLENKGINTNRVMAEETLLYKVELLKGLGYEVVD